MKPTRILEPPHKGLRNKHSAWILKTDVGEMFLEDCAETVGMKKATLYTRIKKIMGWDHQNLFVIGRNGGVKEVRKRKPRPCKPAHPGRKEKDPEIIKVGSWEEQNL